jgi:predicted DCC family thiol-disulfide oxidoreductase YuxK
MSPVATERVVFFDGVCNLCNGTVQFILDRDPGALFHFAALQSDVATKMLAERGVVVDKDAPDSVLLLEGDRVYARSDAVLRITRNLAAPWPLLSVFLVVPRFLRDLGYRFIARHRYRWFGRTDACRVPTPALRARFLA